MKIMKICKYCRYYRQTGFTIDSTQPTHWQRVRWHGECQVIKIVYGESLPSYVTDYDTCHEWKEKEVTHYVK